MQVARTQKKFRRQAGTMAASYAIFEHLVALVEGLPVGVVVISRE